MRRLTATIALVFCAALICGSRAEAQPRGKAANKRGKVLQRIRAMRAWQLTESLELDEVTAGKLFPILNRFDARLMPMRNRAEKLRERLERAIKKGASDATYRQLVTEIQKHHAAMHQWQLARFAAIRKVLSPKQAAIALVALPEIEQRIRHRIREAIRNKRGGVKDPFR